MSRWNKLMGWPWFVERRRSPAFDGPDFADMGTAFGLDESLATAKGFRPSMMDTVPAINPLNEHDALRRG